MATKVSAVTPVDEFKALVVRIVAAVPAEARLAALHGIGRLLDQTEGDMRGDIEQRDGA